MESIVRWKLVFGLAFVLGLGLAHASNADFEIDDVIVSDPQISLADPEFDQSGSRLVWQDGAGDIWTAAIDPVSGEMSPRSGQGTLVASGASPLLKTLNGPEWAFGSNGAFVVFTRSVGDRQWLAIARELLPGIWNSTLLTDGIDRFSPVGSAGGDVDAPARITYFRRVGPSGLLTGYRDLLDPASENVIALPQVRGARWVPGRDEIVASARVGGVEQIVLQETVSGAIHLVGLGGAQPKIQPFAWYAPEFDEILILAALGPRDIVVYRENASGNWLPFYVFALPSERGFVTSLEPLTWNGRSYIVAVAAEEEDSGVGGKPGGPSDIWVASADRDAPFFRQITESGADVVRLDPEAFLLEDEVVVFYTQLVSGSATFVLRRAATGLTAELRTR
jgi:hypothetical protein